MIHCGVLFTILWFLILFIIEYLCAWFITFHIVHEFFSDFMILIQCSISFMIHCGAFHPWYHIDWFCSLPSLISYWFIVELVIFWYHSYRFIVDFIPFDHSYWWVVEFIDLVHIYSLLSLRFAVQILDIVQIDSLLSLSSLLSFTIHCSN